MTEQEYINGLTQLGFKNHNYGLFSYGENMYCLARDAAILQDNDSPIDEIKLDELQALIKAVKLTSEYMEAKYND